MVKMRSFGCVSSYLPFSAQTNSIRRSEFRSTMVARDLSIDLHLSLENIPQLPEFDILIWAQQVATLTVPQLSIQHS